MTRSFISLLAASEWSAVLGLVVKLTLLLAAGAAVAALQRSAAARHFVWTITLSGSLVLAVLAPIAPKLAVPIGHEPKPPATVIANIGGAGGAVGTSGVSSGTILAERPTPATGGVERELSRIASAMKLSALGTLWLFGCAALLLWCLLGHIGLARLARSASPLGGSEWRALFEGALSRNRVARRVRLGRSGSVGAPITWGWSRPVILLPDEAESWPIERRRLAVVHEVAHVARHDYFTQLVASLALAVFWFHPLMWIAARRLRSESEHACDDRVLADGTAAPEYASHLLEVARRARRLRLGGMIAVSMARPSNLERRLLAVLDETRTRRPFSARARAALATTLGVALVPFAGLRPELRAAASFTISPQDQAAQASEDQASDTGASESTSERVIVAKSGEQLYLDLRTGGSVDVRGWDEPRVRVRTRLGGADWRETRVDVSRMAGGVRVRSMQVGEGSSYSTSHSFEVRVPRRFDVRIQSAGGGLTIIDVDGTFRGSTGGASSCSSARVDARGSPPAAATSRSRIPTSAAWS